MLMPPCPVIVYGFLSTRRKGISTETWFSGYVRTPFGEHRLSLPFVIKSAVFAQQAMPPKKGTQSPSTSKVKGTRYGLRSPCQGPRQTGSEQTFGFGNMSIPLIQSIHPSGMLAIDAAIENRIHRSPGTRGDSPRTALEKQREKGRREKQKAGELTLLKLVRIKKVPFGVDPKTTLRG